MHFAIGFVLGFCVGFVAVMAFGAYANKIQEEFNEWDNYKAR